MVREALTSEALGALEPAEAAAYFVARRAEGFTESEQTLLADWLGKDDAHRRALESAEHAWRSFDEPGNDEILTAMRAHALTPRRQSLKSWRPAAAGAALLIAASAAFFAFVPALNPWAPQAPTLEYVTARGDIQELALPDGSIMTLDADSAAVGRFDANARTIELERGRALFDVSPDQARPFAVAAAGHRVVATGTRFDVNLAADGLTVTLLEGAVEITSQNTEPVTLAPGQQYVERQGQATIRTIGDASENVIAWRVGLVSFDDQPLAEAAAVMNRYSQDQIVIGDPTVSSLRVSGQFRAGESQRFADTLAEMHNLRSVRRADQIELIRPE